MDILMSPFAIILILVHSYKFAEVYSMECAGISQVPFTKQLENVRGRPHFSPLQPHGAQHYDNLQRLPQQCVRFATHISATASRYAYRQISKVVHYRYRRHVLRHDLDRLPNSEASMAGEDLRTDLEVRLVTEARKQMILQ
jgi:hypothetical protein